VSAQFATVRQESEARAAGFRVPRLELTIDGVRLENRVLRDVIELTYHDSIDAIDGFELVVANWDAERRRYRYIGSEDAESARDPSAHELETLFEPCAKRVAVKLGYGDDLDEMMTGTFTTMEPTFSASGPHTLAVRGLNELHRMRRAKYDGQWPKKPGALGVKDSEIAKSFDGLVDPKWKSSNLDARRIPMPIEIDKNAKGQEPLIDFVTQKNEYDIDFLWRRARLRGYVVEIRNYEGSDKKFLYFGPSTSKSPTPYQLTWGEGLVDLKVTLTTANQVKKVTVHGWDRVKQKPIEESADWSDAKLKHLNPKLKEIVERCDPREERVVTRPVFTRSEAKAAARDILTGHAQELVKVQGTVIGLPRLRAGSRIKIEGIGQRLQGEYFVTDTTHTLNSSGYLTKFGARREDPDTGERPK
jgi:uncharacterized protein